VNVFRNMNADGWQALRFTHVFAALDKDNYYFLGLKQCNAPGCAAHSCAGPRSNTTASVP
jgi:hypothetical protein